VISLIVPVRDEAPGAPEFFRVFADDGAELLVAADPLMSTAARLAFESAGARVLVFDAPRGARLAAVAREAKGDVLVFLHADTLLPVDWRAMIEKAIAAGAVGGAFRLSFDGGGTRMAFVAFWANVRTALTRVPYGDQAPFVRREVYERLSGHRPWPLLEDVDFGRRLKRQGKVVILRAPVRTSPRRYLETGVARTVLSNWRILFRYHRGEDPEVLAKLYRG
jgi:rSAM/selenodomain-associated transferase 2